MPSSFEYSTRNPEVPMAFAALDAMHTRIEILIPFVPETKARELCSAMEDSIRACEKLFNRFDKASELSRLNREAAFSETTASDELFMILEMCSVFRKSTRGCFDICANSISRTSPPDSDRFTLKAENHSIRFADDRVRLDLGGFGKGYALDRIEKILRSEGISCALVNMGNSSTFALGEHPLGKEWMVSVSHSYYPGKEAGTFALKDSSLSISGRNPAGMAHIIDPGTGNRLFREELIAVCGASPIIAEVLSTALYVSPREGRPEILSAFEGYQAKEIYCHADGTSDSINISKDGFQN